MITAKIKLNYNLMGLTVLAFLILADYHAGAFLSTDGGASWVPINEMLTMKAVTALDISADGQVVYAATWGGGVFRLGDVEIYPTYLPATLKNYAP